MKLKLIRKTEVKKVTLQIVVFKEGVGLSFNEFEELIENLKNPSRIYISNLNLADHLKEEKVIKVNSEAFGVELGENGELFIQQSEDFIEKVLNH